MRAAPRFALVVLCLSFLVASACAHRQLRQEGDAVVATATSADSVPSTPADPLATAPTATAEVGPEGVEAAAVEAVRVPGPPHLDPAGMGKGKGGYYRQVCNCRPGLIIARVAR